MGRTLKKTWLQVKIKIRFCGGLLFICIPILNAIFKNEIVQRKVMCDESYV